MQLELGRRADYAIRATVDLARHYDHAVRRKAREIAEEMGIPRGYVPQILAELVRVGFAASVAGPSGGYVLARPPEEISLLAVVRAADGEPVSRECVLRGGPCRWDDICAVHVPWFEAQQALIQQLDETNFREIVEIDQQLDAGTYRPPGHVAPPERGAVAARRS